MKKPVLLAILDGLGLTEEIRGNAVKKANKPNLLEFYNNYSRTTLRADGEFVGLPTGQMGNSEVGHMNIGAGRVVFQSLGRINESIKDGSFFKNEEYLKAADNAKKNNSAFHILGLLSDGGVHSHINHILAMLELAKIEGLTKVYVHAFLDGRDVDPKSAVKYLDELKAKIDELGVGEIATISGRYYAMDRDKRWERVEKAYNTVILGKGEDSYTTDTYKEFINKNYDNKIYDEFMTPAANKDYSGANDHDSFVFMNFRPDRAIQLSSVITNENYNPMKDNPIFKPQKRIKDIYFVQTMKYSDDVVGTIAYPHQEIVNTLGDIVCEKGLKQLRIAETEKYPHVTFFFDGGVEKELNGCSRILIPSPKVATYDLKPEMSSYEVADALIAELDKGKTDLIILNFANPDMVGHSGMLEPTAKAIEAVDENMGRIITKLKEVGGEALITADHGNSEVETNADGSPNTAHTTNPVPLVLVSDDKKLIQEVGKLGDLAPTLLDLLGIEKPKEMTGISLIDHK